LSFEPGPGGVWTAGYLVAQAPADGLRIDDDADWAVDMTGIAKDDYRACADDRAKPINDLAKDAQSWPQSEAAQAASRELAVFDKTPLFAAIDRMLARISHRYARRCPRCRAGT
jgi:hypothetical protein